MIKKLIYKTFMTAIRPKLFKTRIIDFIALFDYTCTEEIFKEVMRFIAFSKLEGDYLEFGVCEGKSFIAAFRFAQMSRLKLMKFYAFDSFQGLPEITGVDVDRFRQFSEGEYSCSVDEFKKNISKNGVDLNKVKIIPGWYDEVLNEETKKKLPIKKAAVIMIDCDLYKSTVPVLNFITDYVQDGTIILFDDWFCFRGDPNRGEQKAFREWLKKNPSIKAIEYHKYCSHGNSFIIYCPCRHSAP